MDTGFLRETGIQINEMVAGCICCTLVGDFGKALDEVVEKYDPDRMLIKISKLLSVDINDLIRPDEVQINLET